MSFPPSLTTRTVEGRFVTYPDGVGAKGCARIILEDFMQGPTDDMFVAPFERTFKFDENGQFSAILPSNNDPQWTPATYRVVITIDGERRHQETFMVPYDGTGVIHLADVLNMPEATPGESYVLLSTKGIPGGIASLGSDGYVIPSQLPPGSGGDVAWDSIEGKPDVFPHAPIEWDEIENKPDLGDTGPVEWNDIADKPSVFPHDPIAWTDLTGKPSTFPPSTHTHAESEVTGLTADLAGKASSVHTHTESDVPGLTADLAAKANVSDVTTALSGKANTSHTHAQSDVTGLSTALSAKADTSTVNTALDTKADLVSGVIPTAQLPSIAVIDFLGSVSTQSAMLALTGQKGDWCIRTDLGQAWVITGLTPTSLSSWTAMPLAAVPVQTVNGQTGTVVLGPSDIGLGNVTNTSDANKPVSTAQQTALNLKANSASPTFTGTVSGVTAAMVGLGSVNNTSDTAKPVSTAQQTALDLKADLASPTFTGTVTVPTPTAGDNTTKSASTAFVKAAIEAYTLPAILLSAAASVPGGTPSGTLIFRTAT